VMESDASIDEAPPDEPTCDDDEEHPPGEAPQVDSTGAAVEVSMAEVLEEVIQQTSGVVAGENAAEIEWKKMCNLELLVTFNRGQLNPQAMQVHRKFRFIGQKILNRSYAKDDHGDGWGVIKVNHDVAVMHEVEMEVGRGQRKRKVQELVWRIGNVVDLRRLKAEPKGKKSFAQVAECEVDQYNAADIDLNDGKAAIQVRWYHE